MPLLSTFTRTPETILLQSMKRQKSVIYCLQVVLEASGLGSSSSTLVNVRFRRMSSRCSSNDSSSSVAFTFSCNFRSTKSSWFTSALLNVPCKVHNVITMHRRDILLRLTSNRKWHLAFSLLLLQADGRNESNKLTKPRFLFSQTRQIQHKHTLLAKWVGKFLFSGVSQVTVRKCLKGVTRARRQYSAGQG